MVETLLVLVVVLVALLLVLQVRGVSEKARLVGEQAAERARAEAGLREMVQPLQTQLETYQRVVKELETNRAKQEGSLSTQLKELNLFSNPDLTKAQIAKLQKALPKCKILSNPKK